MLADALATDVEVPRQADRWLAADDEVERVVLVGGHGDADLDRPVVVGDVGGDFGLRVPVELTSGGPVEVHHGSGGIDGNLVIAVGIGLQVDFHAVAVPHRLVLAPGAGNVELFTGAFVAADGEVEVLARTIPSRHHGCPEDGLGTGLQLAELPNRPVAVPFPMLVIELAVDDDGLLGFPRTYSAHVGNGPALATKQLGLAAEGVQKTVDEPESLGVDGVSGRGGLGGVEQTEGLVHLRLVLFHGLVVRLAVLEKGLHRLAGGAVEEAAVLGQLGHGIVSLAAPVGPGCKVHLKMIEADVDRIEVLPHREPDVFAKGNSLQFIDAIALHLGYEGGQIEATAAEGIVLEDHDRVVRFLSPTSLQLVDGFALFGQGIAGTPPAHDHDLHVGLKLVDIGGRIGVGPVGAAKNFLLGMRLAYFLGHTVREIPNVVGELAAGTHLVDLLAFAQFALADRAVGVGWHDGYTVVVVDVELGPGPLDGGLKEFRVGITEVIEALAALDGALATIEGEPVGVVLQGVLVVGHGVHPVGHHQTVGVARAQPHHPHGGGIAGRAEANAELPQGEVRLHDRIQFRECDGLALGHHLAQFAGQVPTHAQLLEETADGVEGATFVEGPVALVRFTGQLGGHALAVLVHAAVGHAEACTGHFLPFALVLARDAVGVSLGPWFGWDEVGVVAQKGQPVRTRHKSVGAVLQSLDGKLEGPRALALTDEQFHQALPARLRYHRQLRP